MKKTERIDLRVTEEVKKLVKELSSKENRTVNNYIENLILKEGEKAMLEEKLIEEFAVSQNWTTADRKRVIVHVEDVDSYLENLQLSFLLDEILEDKGMNREEYKAFLENHPDGLISGDTYKFKGFIISLEL